MRAPRGPVDVAARSAGKKKKRKKNVDVNIDKHWLFTA